MQEAPAPAAFFDIDNTLLNFNTMKSFFWFFHRHREWRGPRIGRPLFRLRHRALAIIRMMQLVILSYRKDDRMSANRAFFRGLRGVSVEEYHRIVTLWLAAEKPCGRLYPQVLERLRAHRERAHRIILVSGTHALLVEGLGEFLQVDHLLASEPECRAGRFTGRLLHRLPRVGGGKVLAITECARQWGIDLDASFAYSDHISDLPMLRIVGNPVAVVGDKRLEESALRQGWEILYVDAEATATGRSHSSFRPSPVSVDRCSD